MFYYAETSIIGESFEYPAALSTSAIAQKQSGKNERHLPGQRELYWREGGEGENMHTKGNPIQEITNSWFAK